MTSRNPASLLTRARRTVRRPSWDQRSELERVIERGHRPRYRLDPGAQSVALTFDDGPHPLFTPKVLDALAERDAVATFFVLGRNAVDHPDLVRALVDAGHAVGSHSMTHPVAGATGYRALRRDFRAGKAALEDILGTPVPLFRPPYGHMDLRTAAIARESGVTTWMWSTDPEDYLVDADPEGITERSELADGAVVLLHDAIADNDAAADRSATTAALGLLLDKAARLGLKTVALTA